MKKKEEEEEENAEELEKEIQLIGLGAIKEYFMIDITGVDRETLIELHKKARLGMQFEREFNLSKRAIENNYIRVFRLIAEDKKELKQYIKKSLPQYYPL